MGRKVFVSIGFVLMVHTDFCIAAFLMNNSSGAKVYFRESKHYFLGTVLLFED